MIMRSTAFQVLHHYWLRMTLMIDSIDSYIYFDSGSIVLWNCYQSYDMYHHYLITFQLYLCAVYPNFNILAAILDPIWLPQGPVHKETWFSKKPFHNLLIDVHQRGVYLTLKDPKIAYSNCSISTAILDPIWPPSGSWLKKTSIFRGAFP